MFSWCEWGISLSFVVQHPLSQKGTLLSLYFLKLYMTQEFFSAYLKGLSKYRRMAYFFLKYIFFVLEILMFFYYAN